MKYVSWDIEISKPITGENWLEQRPLGISCAATLTSDGDLRVWRGEPDLPLFGAAYPYQMSPREVSDMASYLLACQSEGYPILTWNGLGFDFDVLAEEVQDDAWAAEIARMAMHHIDMGFLQLCQMGYMIGLDTAAKGLNLAGKTEGMHGDLAPYMWNGLDGTQSEVQAEAMDALDLVPGSREAQDLCLEYVAQDVRTTAEVYEALLDQGHVYWTTRKGTRSYKPWIPVQKGQDRDSASMPTVMEALKIRAPDTSWMTSPRTRESCMGWMEQYK